MGNVSQTIFSGMYVIAPACLFKRRVLTFRRKPLQHKVVRVLIDLELFEYLEAAGQHGRSVEDMVKKTGIDELLLRGYLLLSAFGHCFG